MEIKILDYDLSICKIENFSGVTLESEFCFLGMTDEECSLVCLTKVVPENIIECDKEWKVFRIQGMLYLSLIGVLSRIASLMAEKGIGIFAVSTYNTDHILTKRENFEKAVRLLKNAGYVVC